MKYSVIIPAFECADSIESTVKSVLDSGLEDFEVIIVDDGSADSTGKLCDKLSRENPCVSCIHKENSGVSSARNCGIEASKGEYLLFTDSDDTYDKDAFKNAVKIIEKHNPDMLIFGLSFDYYKNGSLYRRDELAYKEECIMEPSQWCSAFTELFNVNALSPVWNKFYKADIIKNNHLRFKKDVFVMEDFLFVTDCLKYTESMYLLPEIIYRYRQPEDEMRVYTRLNRVDDINTYLTPFYNSIENLEASLKDKYKLSFPEGEKVLFSLYNMFLNQKAYYADTDSLKKLSDNLKASRWADYKTDDILFRDLKNGNFSAILKRNKKIQLRHKIAVTLKNTKLFRLLKGN